jgi:proline dehydrogenase
MRLVDRAIAGFLPYTPKPIVGRVAKRYIAGETMDDAIRVARDLNAKGFRATMDILGEDIHRHDQARRAAKNYRALLEELHRRDIDSNVSIKLTQLGLKVDKRECLFLADSVVTHAREHNNFVRIDMEDSSCTSDTLEIYADLHRRHENVGVVVQAYLHRTANDAAQLEAGLTPVKPNFRLCKGVYVEPESIAYHDMADINRNYLALLEGFLRSGIYVGIATHDERIVREAQRLIAELKLSPRAYEFQMLLGVAEPLRDRIRDSGHPLRVYIPFGRDWYAYSVRRLRENPRLAGYVLKALFKR